MSFGDDAYDPANEAMTTPDLNDGMSGQKRRRMGECCFIVGARREVFAGDLLVARLRYETIARHFENQVGDSPTRESSTLRERSRIARPAGSKSRPNNGAKRNSASNQWFLSLANDLARRELPLISHPSRERA